MKGIILREQSGTWNESFSLTKHCSRWDQRQLINISSNHLNARYRIRVLIMLFAAATKIAQSICVSFCGNQLKPLYMKCILKRAIQCLTIFNRVILYSSNNLHFFAIIYIKICGKLENAKRFLELIIMCN